MDKETKKDLDLLIKEDIHIASFVIKIDDSVIKKMKMMSNQKLIKAKKIKELILKKRKNYLENLKNNTKSNKVNI